MPPGSRVQEAFPPDHLGSNLVSGGVVGYDARAAPRTARFGVCGLLCFAEFSSEFGSSLAQHLALVPGDCGRRQAEGASDAPDGQVVHDGPFDLLLPKKAVDAGAPAHRIDLRSPAYDHVRLGRGRRRELKFREGPADGSHRGVVIGEVIDRVRGQVVKDGLRHFLRLALAEHDLRRADQVVEPASYEAHEMLAGDRRKGFAGRRSSGAGAGLRGHVSSSMRVCERLSPRLA
jgi:hypothetical protein